MIFRCGLVILLATACAHASRPSAETFPTPVAATRTVEVHFADYGRNGMLADHGIATAYVFDDAVKVVLRSGVFSFRPTFSVHLVALSAALVTGDTGAVWDVTRESRKVLVRALKTRADTLTDSVTFWIRNTHDVDLSRHWLMLTEYAQFYVPERGAWAEAHRPIHGELTVFRTP